MVGSLASRLVRWWRGRRDYEFDPARAPHRPRVAELVTGHLPALDARLRRDMVEQLVDRVLQFEQTPIPLVEEPEPRQLTLLVSRAQQAVGQLEREIEIAREQFARLRELFAQSQDDDERRDLIAHFLGATVTDRRELKRDLRAMSRHLGFDVVHERYQRAQAEREIAVELAVRFAAAAARASVVHDDADHRLSARELLEVTRVDVFLAEQLERASRWQIRRSAAQGLIAIYELCGETQPDLIAASVLDVAEARARDASDHAWVQSAALEVLLVAARSRARSILDERLFPAEPAPGRDALFRRLAVTLAGRLLPRDEAIRLLAATVARPDPSEHVRMGVCQALGDQRVDAALPLLADIAGPGGDPSGRVRAGAVIAMFSLLARDGADDLHLGRATDTVGEMLARDRDPLVLRITCEELATLARALQRDDDRTDFEQWTQRWIEALAGVIAAPDAPAEIVDVAAAAAETIERCLDPARDGLTEHLRAVVAKIPPGRRARVRFDSLPAQMAGAAREPLALGRSLAELSRADYGLSARIGSRWITLWRGDRYRFRLWRLLHELRNPAPNKRQAFSHTRGRVARGELRAAPGGMDEATATTVPGERTRVDADGGWGRHLPAIDDLLDLPILSGNRTVQLFSSHGVTTVRPARSLLRRLWNRAYITWRYRALAQARQAALAANEPARRSAFVDMLGERLGIEVAFAPYERARPGGPRATLGARLAALFRGRIEAVRAQLEAGALALIPPIDQLRGWLDANRDYFASATQNSQTALALFASVFATLYFTWAHLRRRRIARARRSLPLVIGGWGTRGKSGTERLKAGLLSGLGYHVMAKTTGCEAMFIHATPGLKPLEIFLYRPYDKATIWEQSDVVTLASRVRADVFLWECMALTPRYVDILQQDWMRDDLATITNAYPDHEDVQGPTGADVADVITRFVPRDSVLITSEESFLPLFVEACRRKRTAIEAVSRRDGDLIADDLLAQFPYREHPRNIALVARLAEQLGIERDLAIATMAEHVVPDLGVLKAYPTVCARGRRVEFVNAMSANERTSFVESWRRVGLDDLDPDDHPGRAVVTVINNRADRVSRSEVFARILVHDIAADRHVLIGTNLKGLRSFIEVALSEQLAAQEIVSADDLAASDRAELPAQRLAQAMRRLRVPRPDPAALAARLRLWAGLADEANGEPRARDDDRDDRDDDERGIGGGDDDRDDDRDRDSQSDALAAHLAEILSADAGDSLDLRAIRRELRADTALTDPLRQLAARGLAAAPSDSRTLPELMAAPDASDLIEHAVELISRIVVRARLDARLARVAGAGRGNPDNAAIARFNDAFRGAYRELFDDHIVPIEDAGATGDAIIHACAGTVPPGVHITLVGVQNIKGTGLDFVYRWLAVEQVTALLAQLETDDAEARTAALTELSEFEDHGVLDAGLVRARLAEHRRAAASVEEEILRDQVWHRAVAIHDGRLARLHQGGANTPLQRVLSAIEGWVDYLDGVRRKRASRRVMNDLVNRRVSHQRAALEMRALVARQKGQWLAKRFDRKSDPTQTDSGV